MVLDTLKLIEVTSTNDAAVTVLSLTSAGGALVLAGPNGTVQIANLPTSDSGLVAGTLWNNGGVLCVV